MRIVEYPGTGQWPELLKRPALSNANLYDTVKAVLDQVRDGGDAAIFQLEKKFDKAGRVRAGRAARRAGTGGRDGRL